MSFIFSCIKLRLRLLSFCETVWRNWLFLRESNGRPPNEPRALSNRLHLFRVLFKIYYVRHGVLNDRVFRKLLFNSIEEVSLAVAFKGQKNAESFPLLVILVHGVEELRLVFERRVGKDDIKVFLDVIRVHIELRHHGHRSVLIVIVNLVTVFYLAIR